MKYAVFTVGALILVFGGSFAAVSLIGKRMKKKPPLAIRIIIGILISAAVLTGGAAAFASVYYPASDEALAVLDEAGVTKTNFGYMIDGEGDKAALVFYPGAKVDAKAYLPLMKRLADSGIDCFLLEVPMRMSIFAPNAADEVISHYDYDVWITAGHSMGGVTAAGYAAEHENIGGVVLLASYPTEMIPDDTALLSVYGTNDKVLERDTYEDSKRFFSENYTEIVIEGGNHAQFGDYGAQPGDGGAEITSQQQQEQTAKAVCTFAADIFTGEQ